LRSKRRPRRKNPRRRNKWLRNESQTPGDASFSWNHQGFFVLTCPTDIIHFSIRQWSNFTSFIPETYISPRGIPFCLNKVSALLTSVKNQATI